MMEWFSAGLAAVDWPDTVWTWALMAASVGVGYLIGRRVWSSP